MEITQLTKLMNILHQLKFECGINPDTRGSQIEYFVEKAHRIVHKEIETRSQFKKESD